MQLYGRSLGEISDPRHNSRLISYEWVPLRSGSEPSSGQGLGQKTMKARVRLVLVLQIIWAHGLPGKLKRERKEK